jgi:hypothetical protein
VPSRELKEDDIVSKLLPDLSKPAKIKPLIGFLGKDNRGGYWRLYLDLTLTEYFEINQNDIIHSQSLKSELSPLGGTVLWIKKDAEISHVKPVSKQVQNQFLSGDIASEFLPQTGLGALIGLIAGGGQYGGLFGGITLVYGPCGTITITIKLSILCLRNPKPDLQ